MRTIGVVTVARSDYGLYRPLLRAIETAPDLALRLFVAGTHLSPHAGQTADEIRADGFAITAEIDMTLAADSPRAISTSMGLGTLGFANAYAAHPLDILVLLGDRYEMLAAAVAAIPFTMPIAHIHGGEITEGAFDDAIRHAITKLSHVHFVSAEPYRQRVIQMGEAPWRVHTCGAPGLDNLHTITPLSLTALSERVGMDLTEAPLLVTYHPVTLEANKGANETAYQIGELLAALETINKPVVFTYPNGDTHAHTIVAAIEDFAKRHPRVRAVKHFGTEGYFSMLRHAAAMLGNSSSGILEAASFGLPVVNVGNRQRGRIHGENVIHCGYSRHDIAAALQQAISPQFRATAAAVTNPYGDGHAAERMIAVLRSVPLAGSVQKQFYDLTQEASTWAQPVFQSA